MPAQTADGTHIITKGELLDMLSRFDDHDRIQVVVEGEDDDGETIETHLCISECSRGIGGHIEIIAV